MIARGGLYPPSPSKLRKIFIKLDLGVDLLVSIGTDRC
jgi:hypothetical protein